MKIAFLLFLVLMLVAAFSAGFWFNRLRWVRAVKAQAETVDKTVAQVRSTVTLTNLKAYQTYATASREDNIDVVGAVQIKNLRTQGPLGNDIVITHCLAPVAKLVERRITRSLGVGLAFTMLFQFAMIVSKIADDLSTPTAPGKAPSLSDLFLRYALDAYGVPSISVIVSAAVVIVFIYFYEELVSRYSYPE